MFRKSRNTQRGAAIAFSAVLAFCLVLLGVSFMYISMFMGGGREIKNAVDAGALNLAKQVIDNVSVDLSGDDNQQFFKDVTDNGNGKVNLRNINRVWAKAMLVALNADAAGGDAGSGDDSANNAYQGAKAISDNLYDQLTNAQNLYGFFTDYAQRNSVRMLGSGVNVIVLPGPGWNTSLMERSAESNISVDNVADSFTALGHSIPGGFMEACTRNPQPQDASGMQFLIGYKPLEVGGRTFWTVPFQFEEKPHMVASSTFTSNLQATNPLPAGWDTAIPNSFSVEGQVKRPDGHNQIAMSWVETNPHQTFNLCMPHSFVHIKVDDMKSHWYFFPTGYPPIEFGPAQEYGYTTDDQTGTPMPAGGVLCSTVTPDTVTLGFDVVGRPLDQIIFGAPDGDTTELENDLVNRCNEMVNKLGTKFSASDVHSALSDFATYGYLVAGQRDFYLYSPDGKTLTCQPKFIAMGMSPWLFNMIDNDPDGKEKKLVDDASMPGPIFFSPIVTPDPFCIELFSFGWGTWDKDLYWTPGTGYNGCLGTVRVKRWTDVYSLGICTPVI